MRPEVVARAVREVKGLASGRIIRATLPGADEAVLRAMPGVDGVEVRGETVLIHSGDTLSPAAYIVIKMLTSLVLAAGSVCAVYLVGAVTNKYRCHTGRVAARRSPFWHAVSRPCSAEPGRR